MVVPYLREERKEGKKPYSGKGSGTVQRGEGRGKRVYGKRATFNG